MQKRQRAATLRGAVARASQRGVTILLALLCFFAVTRSSFALGQPRYIEDTPDRGSFPIVQTGVAANVFVDTNDYAGVVRAVGDLQADIARVTGVTPKIVHEAAVPGTNAILVGTVGHSAVIDRLVREGKIDVTPIAGKWESFLIQVVSEPLPGVANALVITGSDKRGTIYGVYDLSEQMGVSPWYWWADVPVAHRDALFVKPGRYVQGPPAVKYRGIFLNDEAPALTGLVNEKFGGYNHKFYTNVFELLLRLKANYLWPAMWNNSFVTDDPLNPKLADEYGIVMGTSHHEPMMRAWKEWERAGHGKGTWDYSKNSETLRAFWAEGIRRTKDYEKVITLAMRGDGDEPMSETESIALLEKIVADQRKIITETVNTSLSNVPQVWALYKEVQGYYEKGMRVPDDVTLLWCDDNWGNIRRLPTESEQKRVGGAGVYYHFDYVGGPRNYKWLNTSPIAKVWEQMNLAYHHGVDRIWIVNVGDLKPMEIPIEFFLTLAWQPERWPKERIADYTRLWAEREFGPTHAAEIADIVAKYTKFNGRRKPELLEPTTYSLVDYQEAETMLADWKAITAKAEQISRVLPENARDAFFQLVLHPTKACAIVNELYVTVGKNRLYASQGRVSANDLAAQARALFQADQALSDYYNQTLAGGKWSHMMDQTHIGYTYWQQPPSNSMPNVTELQLPEAAQMGVAIEGSASAWPGATNEPVLPTFDVFNQPRRYVDVFNRGKTPFEFSATPSAPWLVLSDTEGKIDKEQRLWVSVNWSEAPKGTTDGFVKITGAGADVITVKVEVFNPKEPTRGSLKGFVEADGYVSIEAEHFTKKSDTTSAHWEEIPDFGRTQSGMTIFPVTTTSVTPPESSPHLEYQTYLFSTGAVEVISLLAPCVNYAPDRGVRIAVSFDDEAPQIVTVVPKGHVVGDGNRDWEESVKDSVRKVKTTHTISRPGYHALRIWMVDPGVVVQKLVVNTGGLKPSYLGPPESYRNPLAADGHWVGTWGCGPQLTEPSNLPPAPGLTSNTLRQVVHVSIGGKHLRARFSNAYGANPVTMNSVHVALNVGTNATSTINPATDKAVTFRGVPSMNIPPDEVVLSDPFDFDLPPLSNLTITIYFGETPGNVTGHPGSRTTSYIQAGNAVAATNMPSAATTAHWYILTGIDVLADSSSRTLVTLGDSITDGRGTTTDGNNRWPDNLARRLAANAPTAAVAVVNQGIGGNAVLTGGLGPTALARFDRDVLGTSGARWLIVFEGVNDIGSGSNSMTTATNLIAAYTEFANKAHARNVLAYGATITPFGGNGYYSTLHEAERQFVNAWFRTNTLYDGVIDFDAVVRDPVTLTNLLSAYDTGDHLHLNPAGYKAMADAIDLTLFTP